ADANAVTSMPVIAMATAAIAADASGVVLLMGFVRKDAWTWTVGGLLYASTDPGALTHTKPSGATDQIQVVGKAFNTDIVIFKPGECISSVIEVGDLKAPTKALAMNNQNISGIKDATMSKLYVTGEMYIPAEP
ncbi:unnamed protein product, partial [marine sediment metagenome]